MVCTLCPRRCGAVRTDTEGGGFCAMPALPVVARAALHHWEEPCISGTRGSGTIFFSGCSLRCVFCQNHSISHDRFGKTITVPQLRELCLDLIAQGAHNINFVTPTHFSHAVAAVLKEPLSVPVVYNCGGYERLETLQSLQGNIQIYLPDLKYADNALAERYSAAPDYFETAAAAIREMVRQTGPCRFDSDGLMISGVIIRHLLLPGALNNTKAVLDWISETFVPGQVLVSLMAQYTPQPGAEGLLARRVTGAEYRSAAAYMENVGIQSGYTQDAASARAAYTPDFDLTGLAGLTQKEE